MTWCEAVWAAGAPPPVVERNLPLAPQASPSQSFATPASPPASTDETILAPHLVSLTLLGPTDAVTRAAANTVDAHRLGDHGPGLARTLKAFLGRPLSRRLMGEIEVEIVRAYRAAGRPFVSVSLPEQEITGGALAVRVIEIRLESVAVASDRSQDTGLTVAVRRSADGVIDAPRLSQDIDWLNRDPFRRVTANFNPGAALGATDLTLNVDHLRPWSLSGGYANSGSPSTGEDRYFVGGGAALPAWSGASTSFQATGSRDFWNSTNGLFGDPHPQYRSFAVRFDGPATPRQSVSLSLDGVESNTTTNAFGSRQSTVEAALTDQFALSNLLPLPGDLVLGLEAKRQNRVLFFGGERAFSASADVYQLLVGWSGAETDRWGATSVDAEARVAPGNIDAQNSDEALERVEIKRHSLSF